MADGQGAAGPTTALAVLEQAPLAPRTGELHALLALPLSELAQRLCDAWFDSHTSRKTSEDYRGDLRALALFEHLIVQPGDRAAPRRVLEHLLLAGPYETTGILERWRAAMLATPAARPSRRLAARQAGRPGLAPASINRRLAAVRSLLRYATSRGVISWGGAIVVKGLKRGDPIRDTRGPGGAAFAAMLRLAARQEPAKAARDVAILRLFHDLALRRAELLGIQRQQVDLGEHGPAVWILRKGATETTRRTLPAPTAAALASWIVLRGGAPGPLWTSFNRGPKRADGALTAIGLYHLVRSLSERVQAPTRPHGLRHLSITRAVQLSSEHGLPLPDVLAHSGHAKGSLGLLAVYYDSEVDRAGQFAGWLADDKPTPLP